MLTFLNNLYCPKVYHKPDHSIRIVEYHRKKLSSLNPSSPRHKPRTIFGVVTLFPVISSCKQTTLVLAPFFYRASPPSYRIHLHRESNPGQILGVLACVSVISSSKQTTLDLGAVLLPRLVSELQKTSSSGIEPRTVFRDSGLCFCNLLFDTNNFFSLRRSSTVLNFRATGNALTWNRAQDTFPEF
jgi:hypothetical protein